MPAHDVGGARGVTIDHAVQQLLMLGGLLIWLGGPFWTDTIANITKVLDAARSLSGAGQPPPAHAAPAAAGAAPTLQPRTPVDAFKVANVQ